jgi:hypothetical protein
MTAAVHRTIVALHDPHRRHRPAKTTKASRDQNNKKELKLHKSLPSELTCPCFEVYLAGLTREISLRCFLSSSFVLLPFPALVDIPHSTPVVPSPVNDTCIQSSSRTLDFSLSHVLLALMDRSLALPELTPEPTQSRRCFLPASRRTSPRKAPEVDGPATVKSRNRIITLNLYLSSHEPNVARCRITCFPTPHHGLVHGTCRQPVTAPHLLPTR